MLTSCTSSQLKNQKTGGPLETLIWSSDSQRPQWTITEPDVDGEILVFVGISNKYSSEKEARNDALRSATNQVVGYLGTMAKDKYEKIARTFGLTSSVVDPTISSREYEKQLRLGVVKHLKSKKWYLERWNTPTGIGWKAFVFATVPISAVNNSFKESAKQNMISAQRRAKEAADEFAKKQAENSVKMFEQASEEGLIDE